MRRLPLLTLSLLLSLFQGIFFVPRALFAAEVTVLPEQKAVIQTAEFETSVMIDTGGENINTFSGTLVFPKNIVQVKEIRTGGSIVNYWVEEPTASENEIRFSGMTPGGFNGSRGILFAVVFTATEQGRGTISITDPLFLKNDGKGTTAKIALSNSSIEVLAPDIRRNVTVPEILDTTPPEPFTPVVSRTPALFGNAWLLFFATEDKGSGMDNYEVQEHASGFFSFFAPWVRATSPYLLKDQSVSSAVAVKAVDKAGNTRTVFIKPLHPPAWYASLDTWFILIGILVVLITAKTLLWRKR